MTIKKDAQPVLIIEDSPEDYETILRAFRKTGLVNPIIRFENDDEALDYLFRRGNYAAPDTSTRPGIILLDLNLPGTDGRQVLEELKQHTFLRSIPIVVLTSSDDEHDIRRCYELGANSYIRKPVEMGGFFEAITRIKEFWFGLATLPIREEI